MLNWLKAPRVPLAPPHQHDKERPELVQRRVLTPGARQGRRAALPPLVPHPLLTPCTSTRARLARARARRALSLGGAGLDSELLPGFPHIMKMLQAAENSKCCFNYVL